MIDQSFWANKKVLVTGCTGFKGSWLVTWLLELGAEVYGYSLTPPTSPSMFELLNLSNKLNYKIGDIRNYEAFKAYLDEAQVEIVFHLAAQPLVRYSYDNPIETYHTNVLGLVNVLESIRQNNQIKAVVNVTSDKCYENREWIWGYRESDPMGGYDPYSNSKGCAELVTSCYQHSYFPKDTYGIKHSTLLASGRAGNVIGGGDWATDRLIPDIIRAFLANETVFIRNPLAIRPWQHVLEPLSGYLLLAQKLYAGGVDIADGWNFGPLEKDTRNVESIIGLLSKLWAENTKWELDKSVQPHEANYLKLDCSKAHSLLAWQPKWSLEYTLEQVVKWYKDFRNSANLYEATVAQITQYMES